VIVELENWKPWPKFGHMTVRQLAGLLDRNGMPIRLIEVREFSGLALQC
jgi:hypothetical protein